MRAVGEVMSIGKTYKEAFQKSIRSLETGRYGLGFAKDFHERSLEELLGMLREPSSERQFVMYEALRKGANVEELFRLTHIKAWFIEQMKELVSSRRRSSSRRGAACRRAAAPCKERRILGPIPRLDPRPERDLHPRAAQGARIVQAWDAVPVSGVENASYYTRRTTDKTRSP